MRRFYPLKACASTMIDNIWLFAVLPVFVLLIATLLLLKFIRPYNSEKWVAIGTILAAIVGIFALIFVGTQATHLSRQLKLQAETFELEHRPYLYLHIPPGEVRFWRNDVEGGWFAGGDLRFRNVGKDPATIRNTQYMVASDRRGVIDFIGWFEKEFGGFPDIKVVFPGQEDARVPCHPTVAERDKIPRLLYIGAVTSYEGPQPGRSYWYKFSQLYVLEFVRGKDDQGRMVERFGVHPLKPEHDWDRNTNSPPPGLVEPRWQDYLSQGYIHHLTKGATN